jgi:hypothetical protein
MTERFVRRSDVVEAAWYDGLNAAGLAAWGVDVRPTDTDGEIIVGTVEDGNSVEHVVSVGDYIVRGVAGEFYPVKPDIFALTYEWVKS